MHQSKKLTILASAALVVAVVFVWKKRDAAENSFRDDDGVAATIATESNRRKPRGDTGYSVVEEVIDVKPLALPPGSLPMLEKEPEDIEGPDRAQRFKSVGLIGHNFLKTVTSP